MKKNLTRTKVALIGAAASMLTSGIHGFFEAMNTPSLGGDILRELAYVVGRVIGDLPAALICFGLVYDILRAKGIDGVEAKPQ